MHHKPCKVANQGASQTWQSGTEATVEVGLARDHRNREPPNKNERTYEGSEHSFDTIVPNSLNFLATGNATTTCAA